ncbi:cytochrome P450 CYP736A12-like [Lotus japonicus]|uniref:cytochrome P450 CYP736A12-like n=1 Tax=Lotus japonicus TaxID=34305 RepID=UPI002585BFCA|nr:cytochrome P450 CYP736A12-like [Lotus japonicus]
MFSAAIVVVQACLVFMFIHIIFRLLLQPKKQRNIDGKKPPGPSSLPIIGNLHMIGTLPHRTLQSLSQKHGPIMSLKLGKLPTIVVSSSETAELFLKTHDLVFASRPKVPVSKILFYGNKGLAFCEYGSYWRSVKKVCVLQLLTTSKIELFAPIRKEELGVVVKSLEEAAAVGEVVNLSKVLENLAEDIVYKMILGCSKNDEHDLKRLIHEALTLLGTFDLADFVPWIGPFDLQGLTRRCKKTSKALDVVLEKIITEHEQTANKEGKTHHHHKDFVDILLSMMNQPLNSQNHVIIMDRTHIKAILLDMIIASIETSATVIEWALSELLSHPRVMKILQDEIDNEVGISRMVEENDLVKLSYLDNVVDETLRLHPVAPLLIPRECRESITINGYYIEKNSRVIVNVWAIGRDPNVWSENVETFYPERFVNKKMNYQGKEFHSVPFGSGRRGCPGAQLGLVTVKLVLAQLVHCFNWDLPSNISPANLNMQEKFGLTITRVQQLQAIPTSRLANDA